MTLECTKCNRDFDPAVEGDLCLVCGHLVCGHCAGQAEGVCKEHENLPEERPCQAVARVS